MEEKETLKIEVILKKNITDSVDTYLRDKISLIMWEIAEPLNLPFYQIDFQRISKNKLMMTTDGKFEEKSRKKIIKKIAKMSLVSSVNNKLTR